MIERGEVLWKFPLPKLDGAALAILARWTAGIILAALAIHFGRKWIAAILSRKLARRRAS